MKRNKSFYAANGMHQRSANAIRGAIKRIEESFAFADTPQGAEYWHEVRANLEALARTADKLQEQVNESASRAYARSIRKARQTTY